MARRCGEGMGMEFSWLVENQRRLCWSSSPAGLAKTCSVTWWCVKGKIDRCMAGVVVDLVGGRIHMPRQRLADCWRRMRPRLRTQACDSVSFLSFGRDLLLGSVSGCVARQNPRTGQIWHLGCARQTSAPRSMSAELKIRAPRFGTNVEAICQIPSRPGPESIGCL